MLTSSYKERYKRTHEALHVWYESLELSNQNWEACETDDDVAACERIDEERAKPVREAIYEDTKHINNWAVFENMTVSTIISVSQYRIFFPERFSNKN